ncbi:unnamed protein product [Camellia sinensis]
MPYSLRRLFATILIHCAPNNPKQLWEKFKDYMAEDYAKTTNLSKQEIFKKVLQSINSTLQSMGKDIKDFNICSDNMLSSDNQETCRNQGCFFIDGPGGTGKTFLYKALLAAIRSKNYIALATTTSRVATSILPRGRTAHSRFKIPIDVDTYKSCNIGKQTGLANLLRTAKLIIWDEAPMAKRQNIEALNDMLKDINESELLFGGKVVVLGGDFRQIPPIIPKGTKYDSIDASLVNSELWKSVEKIKLTENMRARHDPCFSNYLLRIGNGSESVNDQNKIKIPASMIISNNFSNAENSIKDLIQTVFPNLKNYSKDPISMINSVVLTPKNDCIQEINALLIKQFPTKGRLYTSIDKTIDPNDQGQYEDFLNSLEPNGLPPHHLELKINSPIMTLRNIDPSIGLCNGTRLICRDLKDFIICAEIAVRDRKGQMMMNEEITPIKKITSTTKQWTAKIRVLEKWNPRIPKTGLTRYQRLILADVEGTQVQAILYEDQIEQFQDTFKVFNSYYVSNAAVKLLQEKYHITPQSWQWQWTITASTLIQDVENSNEDNNAPTYHFVPFNEFSDHLGNETSSIDILAAVIQIKPPKTITTENGTTTAQEIVLINEELMPIVLTLWGQFVTNEGERLQAIAQSFPTLIAIRLKVSSFRAAHQLHNWCIQNEEVIRTLPSPLETHVRNITTPSPKVDKIISISSIPSSPDADGKVSNEALPKLNVPEYHIIQLKPRQYQFRGQVMLQHVITSVNNVDAEPSIITLASKPHQQSIQIEPKAKKELFPSTVGTNVASDISTAAVGTNSASHISAATTLPFTMWVLQGAVKMVWSLPEVMRVACTFMLVMLLWLALWSFGAAGVVASSMRDGGRWWLLVNKVFSVSLFWTSAILCNTVHVIMSGMVFLILLHGGQEAASMPSKPLMKSLWYAMTTFGSICYGSLFTAAIWTLRWKIRGFKSKIGNNVCCCAVLIFLFYLVETLVRFFNKYAYVQVESSVSAPTDGQNTRGLTMAQAPSDMVWHLSIFTPNYEHRRALGKAIEALPLPAFSNWAWQMQSHSVVLKSTVVDIFIEF